MTDQSYNAVRRPLVRPVMHWETPPPAMQPRDWRRLVCAELASRPGEWARVQDDASASAYMAWRKHGAEVRTRKVPGTMPCKFTIWARWPEEI